MNIATKPHSHTGELAKTFDVTAEDGSVFTLAAGTLCRKLSDSDDWFVMEPASVALPNDELRSFFEVFGIPVPADHIERIQAVTRIALN